MKQFIIIFFMSFFINFSYSQDYTKYYMECNEALTAKINGQYEIAIEKYENIFNSYYPFIDDYTELKNCYKALANIQKQREVWERMICNGFVKDNKIFVVYKKPLLTQWEKKIPNDELEIFNSINYDSLHQIYLDKHFNQKKNNYLSAIISCEIFTDIMRTEENQKNFLLIQNIGYKTNGLLLMNLLNSDEYPSRQESYLWEDERFIASIVHIGKTLKDKELIAFFDLLKIQVSRGNISNNQYANIYDSVFGYIYGNEFIIEEGKIGIKIPKNIDEVNKNRSKLYLIRLEDFAKNKGYQLK